MQATTLQLVKSLFCAGKIFFKEFHMDSGCPCDFARMYSKKNKNYEYKRAETNGTGSRQSAGVPVGAKAATANEPGELVVSTDAGSGGSGGGLAAQAAGEAGADLFSRVGENGNVATETQSAQRILCNRCDIRNVVVPGSQKDMR